VKRRKVGSLIEIREELREEKKGVRAVDEHLESLLVCRVVLEATKRFERRR